jgi:RNA polymerase sigma-70 factor (ECF subfamily)
MATELWSRKTRISLIERARGGDADELASLYAPLVYRLARRGGLDEESAKDVAQDAMIAVVRAVESRQYDPERASFRGFIRKIVSNKSVDWLRERKAPTVEDLGQILDPDYLDPARVVEKAFDLEWKNNLLEAALMRARHELSMTTYQSFQLVEVEGMSIADAARELGLRQNAVSQNKRRVMLRLRMYLRDLERDVDESET